MSSLEYVGMSVSDYFATRGTTAVEMYLGKCKFSSHQIIQREEVACCIPMFHGLIDGVFQYDEVRNRIFFTVNTVDRVYLNSKQKQRVPKKATCEMMFCSCCGSKLPDYTDEYYEAMEEQMQKLGITYEDIDEGKATIPEEFLSDVWWRKRNIRGLGKSRCKFSLMKVKRNYVFDD